jgi:membrane associated rhomboid family serine protease
MGAYIVLFPHVRVFTIVPLGFYVTNIALPAWVMLFYWAFLQFVGGVGSVLSAQTGGVAFWAHLGGFIAGVVLVKIFERRDRVTAHASHRWEPKRVGWR